MNFYMLQSKKINFMFSLRNTSFKKSHIYTHFERRVPYTHCEIDANPILGVDKCHVIIQPILRRDEK